MTPHHVPVLLQEVLDTLSVKPLGRYVDATLGLGGYTKAIVARGGSVLALDADGEALINTQKQWEADDFMQTNKERWQLLHGNFRDIERLVLAHGWKEVDGVVFDLGVSSIQLDTPQKGFSYRFSDAPLDMRFDQTQGEPAAEFIRRATEQELYENFARLGEEKHARSIARAVVRARSVNEIATAGQLAAIVQEALDAKTVPTETLSRVFQALRMQVNDEKGALREGLAGATKLLGPGGRLVVVSFHSLEDRIVKLFLQKELTLVTKKPVTATEKEIYENRRSRSAKLRAGIKP